MHLKDRLICSCILSIILEIDIYDIPVAQITEQYLIYIHTMKELQLDLASEFLVMAATLLAIKSKMLLPESRMLILTKILHWRWKKIHVKNLLKG